MKTLLRWLVRIILGLLALVVLCLAVLVAANWRDDPLTPQAARLLAPPTPPAPDTPNAYYVLLGLAAPDDEDAATTGRHIRDQIDRAFLQNATHPQYSEMPWNKAFCSSAADSTCAWPKLRCPLQENADCVAFYLAEQPRVQQFIAQQSVLLRRYRQFSQIPVFDEPPIRTADEPLPAYQFLTQAAEMRLAQAVFALNQSDLQAGTDTLMQEIGTHRRLLVSSTQLITKMIAVAMLRRDYAVLSNAIEHWPPLARQAALAGAWQPLSTQEYDLSRAMEAEATWQAHTMYTMLYQQKNLSWQEVMEQNQNYRWPWWPPQQWGSPPYLPQTTVNMFARWANEETQAIAGDTATLDTRHRAYTNKWTAELNRTIPFTWWQSIRNPTGKFLLSVAAPDPFAYAERLQDLNGYVRLVALQAALRQDGVPPAQIAAYVQRAPPDLRNPYDGQPMHWDAAHATLSFEGRQKSPLNPKDTPKIFSVHLKFRESKEY